MPWHDVGTRSTSSRLSVRSVSSTTEMMRSTYTDQASLTCSGWAGDGGRQYLPVIWRERWRRILPVGGIREKVTAAKRMGIREIIFPVANEADIDVIPKAVRKGIKFHSTEWFDDIVRIAFSGRIKVS